MLRATVLCVQAVGHECNKSSLTQWDMLLRWLMETEGMMRSWGLDWTDSLRGRFLSSLWTLFLKLHDLSASWSAAATHLGKWEETKRGRWRTMWHSIPHAMILILHTHTLNVSIFVNSCLRAGKTWHTSLLMSAPASSSICTMASSPRTQAYISGVIPCTTQHTHHHSSSSKCNETQTVISPLSLVTFLVRKADISHWHLVQILLKKKKKTSKIFRRLVKRTEIWPLNWISHRALLLIILKNTFLTCSLGTDSTTSVILHSVRPKINVCFPFWKKSVLHRQSIPGGSLYWR